MLEQIALDLDSPLIGKVKNDRTTMVFNFFALTKDRITDLPVYDDGRVRIEVTSTKHGVATIWDKEILIYLASLMQDKLNRSETITKRFTFTAHDFFRITGTKANGQAYDRLLEGLTRLQGTQIRTNIETGGEGEDGAFSWITDYKVQYRRRDGEKVMRAITVELCEWLYRAILKDQRVLTYDPKYFQLPPIEKRLYEIARAHCGHQGGFKMNIEKLRLRVGTENDLRRFKAKLIEISKRKYPLPEYGLSVIDPRRHALDRKMPPPPGRTPLKSYLVFFFRTDRLSSLPALADAPELLEGDEL